MSDEILKADENNQRVIGLVTDDAAKEIRMGRIDDTTKGLKVMLVGGSGTGTVTSVSIVSANGISGTVATATTTPAITLSLGNITPSGVQVSGLTASEIVATDVSKNLMSLAVATYPSLTELSYVKGVTSGIQTQLNGKQASGTYVTAITIASANGISGSSSGGATPALTIALGAITPTSVNGLTITANGTNTLNIGAGKTLTVSDSTTLANASITLANTKALTLSDSTTLNTNAITLGGGEVITFSASNALSLLTTGTTVMTFPAVTDTVVTLAASQTLTNKRITPRILSAASYTTDTGTSINGDTLDMFIVTAQTGALKFNNPTGTPTDGQKLILSVASSTTAARALTWDTAYGATTIALPTTTAATTATLTIGFIWSASKSLWQCVAVA